MPHTSFLIIHLTVALLEVSVLFTYVGGLFTDSRSACYLRTSAIREAISAAHLRPTGQRKKDSDHIVVLIAGLIRWSASEALSKKKK